MPSRRSPAVAKRQLRLRLRRARTQAGKTQTQVAEALDWSPSKILRIENGQVTVATSDLVALATQYPSIGQEQVEELIKLARESRRPTVSSKYRDVLTPQFAEWLEYEGYATTIRQYETKIIPGIIQTDSYALGIVQGLLAGNAKEETAARIVDSRLERARPLIGPDGPDIEFIIDEAAIRRAVGNEHGSQGFHVIIDQLEHLKKVNTVGRRARGGATEESLNPNISVQIVPFAIGTYAAMRGPFEVIEFDEDEDDPMVYLENPEGDVVIRDSLDASVKYMDLFSDLSKKLPGPSTTSAQIDAIIRLMENGTNGIVPIDIKE